VNPHDEPANRAVQPASPRPGSEADAVARLQSQPWVRPGNGQRVLGSDHPARVAPGTATILVNWVRDG